MSTAEKLITQGEIRLLQRLIEQKFPDAGPVDLEGLSREQLERIGERILTCDTLDEVLAGLIRAAGHKAFSRFWYLPIAFGIKMTTIKSK